MSILHDLPSVIHDSIITPCIKIHNIIVFYLCQPGSPQSIPPKISNRTKHGLFATRNKSVGRNSEEAGQVSCPDLSVLRRCATAGAIRLRLLRPTNPTLLIEPRRRLPAREDVAADLGVLPFHRVV